MPCRHGVLTSPWEALCVHGCKCTIQTYKLFIMSESREVKTFTFPFVFRSGYEQRQTAVCDEASPLFASFTPPLPPKDPFLPFLISHLLPMRYKHLRLLTSMWLSSKRHWVTQRQWESIPQWQLSHVVAVATCARVPKSAPPETRSSEAAQRHREKFQFI